jgi:hypothetical protein
LANQWSGKNFVVVVQSIRSPLLRAVSGSFTLGGSPYVTSARRLLVNRFAAPLDASSWARSYQGQVTVRMQCVYSVAALIEAGLPLQDRFSGLLFQLDAAFKQPLSDVRVALFWLSDAELSQASPTSLLSGGIVVTAPEVVAADRLQAGAWLRLGCADSEACRWNFQSQNLVVELSYVNAGLGLIAFPLALVLVGCPHVTFVIVTKCLLECSHQTKRGLFALSTSHRRCHRHRVAPGGCAAMAPPPCRPTPTPPP